MRETICELWRDRSLQTLMSVVWLNKEEESYENMWLLPQFQSDSCQCERCKLSDTETTGEEWKTSQETLISQPSRQ